MIKQHIPERGDVYLIDPDTEAGRGMKSRHRFIVITRSEINQLGIASTVPVSTGTAFSHAPGLTVAIHGYNTIGVAVCNQVRTFDIADKMRQGSAKFVERLNDSIMMEIINRVVSIIDPA